MKERWWSDTKEGEDISSCARDPSRQLCLVSYVSFLLPSSVPSLTAMCINIAVRLSHPPTRESIIDSCYYLNLPIEMEPSLAPLVPRCLSLCNPGNFGQITKLGSSWQVCWQFNLELREVIQLLWDPVNLSNPHTHTPTYLGQVYWKLEIYHLFLVDLICYVHFLRGLGEIPMN